jgi:purine-nucleoside phosphorylase
MSVLDQIQAASSYIKKISSINPSIGVVLGSGLNGFLDYMNIEHEIDYKDIPHFPVSTVEGHSGKLVLGKLADRNVVVMSGRFHYYEGYTSAEVVFPVRVMKYLGVTDLLISNAAGGVQQGFKVGDLMIIKDHISFAIVNPLLGKNESALGPRFPDMSEPYFKLYIKKAHHIAKAIGVELKEGVYFGVTGPTFETRAEYKLINTLGADAVGMSTVQEVITAVHCGMRVFAMSVITDIGIREEENVITHADVLDAAKLAAPRLALIFKGMVESINIDK